MFLAVKEIKVIHCTCSKVITRTGKGGGRFCPPLMFFCDYLSKYSFDRRDFFNTCPKINGAPFGAKIEVASIFGGLFLTVAAPGVDGR